MRLRTKTLLRAAALASVLLLTACGGGGEDSAETGGSECVWGQSEWNDCNWAG